MGTLANSIIEFYSGGAGVIVSGLVVALSLIPIWLYSRVRDIKSPVLLSFLTTLSVTLLLVSPVVVTNAEIYSNPVFTLTETPFLFEIAIVIVHAWPIVWIQAFARKRRQSRRDKKAIEAFE